ncbi:hypothetical protein HQ590_15325 [bacterium]|nr:hypothetical protein [bacterium]
MIKSFFHDLDDHGVESLLISGQAAVLYGAATFSEDIDLWINPTAANAARFQEVLRVQQARYYKLTPPWQLDHLEQGHGFHFVLPGGDEPDWFLDVLGRPPRVTEFATARRSAPRIDSDWGPVVTVGIQDLGGRNRGHI